MIEFLAAAESFIPAEATILVAIIGAMAVLIVGLLNFFGQRKLVRQQSELLDRQLTAQREQSERQQTQQSELLDRQLTAQREQSERQQTQQGELLDRQLTESRQQLAVVREGQIVDRFTRVIDQLGKEKVEIQLGAIYALERIAEKSEGDRASIIEILTAYVRGHSFMKPVQEDSSRGDVAIVPRVELPPLRVRAADVQAVMTVLGRLAPIADHVFFEFGKVDLRKADLINAKLNGANLEGATLEASDLSGAELKEANLKDANLNRANLSQAELGHAQLEGATLEAATLWRATLYGANLSKAILRGAVLKKANLMGTNLTGVVGLSDADLTDARANSQTTTFPLGFDRQDARASGVIFKDS
jgi:uncharacterized protein YjbI with pentapeptide repeats